jgi:hypothetical protein
MIELGRLRNLNWMDYNLFDVVFDHSRMSADALKWVMPVYFCLLYFFCSRGGLFLLLSVGVLVWSLARILIGFSLG